MARSDFVFGEKVHFSFSNHVAHFAVKKMKRDRGATRDFGKIVWQVTQADVPGSALKVGDVLPTRRVFYIAKDIDPRAAHAFDMENQQ
ncbi:MAG: hypothetical protein HY699_00630 [Deltaproteobacteria bacterium]|nr:hypothetical protein [Deltaproteobacteria bacterium]